MKKPEQKNPVPGTSYTSAATSMTPFEHMKNALKNNLKGLKKDDDTKDSNSQEAPVTIGGASSGIQ